MSEFFALKQTYYHKVAVGPFEMPTYSLIGSDIVLHLPVLEYYASLCKHVTELGVREGHSTVALIAGCQKGGKVHSYDIEDSPAQALLKDLDLPVPWHFHKGDSLKVTLDDTDMILFDTLHTYDQLSQELALHARKASKFLAFHDTFTCGEKDLSGPDPNARGIIPAIEEFLAKYPSEYKTVYRTICNNGMWILSR